MVDTLLKSENSIQITPHFKWNLIFADPDDNKFVDCALNAGADYLVTNDSHFNVLKSVGFLSINVVDIDTYKHIFQF